MVTGKRGRVIHFLEERVMAARQIQQEDSKGRNFSGLTARWKPD